MFVGYIAFVIVFAAMLAVLAVMALRITPRIVESAGGRKLFDVRFGGYDFDEAKDLLQALTPEAANTYLKMTTFWDMFFPVLYGAVLWAVVHWATPPGFPIPSGVLGLIALLPVYCDFRENALVAAMLMGGPDELKPELVARASFWTVWKWRLLALVLGIIACLIVLMLLRSGHSGAVS